MAVGKAHAAAAGAGVLITGGAAVIAAQAGYPGLGLAATLGAIMGWLLTPDIDLEGRTVEETRLYRVPIIGFLWQWFWYGYALLFGHRGWSHKPVWGTCTRLIYLLLVGMLVTLFWLGGQLLAALIWPALQDWLLLPLIPWSWGINFLLTAPLLVVVCFGFWCLQDLVHILMDTKTYKYLSNNVWALFLVGGITTVCIFWLVLN